MPLNNWYWQTLLMRKRIGFILFEKVTILDIYPHKGIYFFETIFENYRICPIFEFSVSEKKMFEKFVSEQEIWVARIVVRKKLIWIVTQKCLPKNLQKQHCCISDGWRWKKVTGELCGKTQSIHTPQHRSHTQGFPYREIFRKNSLFQHGSFLKIPSTGIFREKPISPAQGP